MTPRHTTYFHFKATHRVAINPMSILVSTHFQMDNTPFFHPDVMPLILWVRRGDMSFKTTTTVSAEHSTFVSWVCHLLLGGHLRTRIVASNSDGFLWNSEVIFSTWVCREQCHRISKFALVPEPCNEEVKKTVFRGEFRIAWIHAR